MNWIKFEERPPPQDNPDRLVWVRYVAKDSYGVLSAADALEHRAVVVWWAEIEPPPPDGQETPDKIEGWEN